MNNKLEITNTDKLTASLERPELREKWYRLLVEHMNEALMVCDLEYGPEDRPKDVIILQINQSMGNLLGLHRNKVPISAIIAGLPELYEPSILKALDAVAKGQSPINLAHRFEKLNKDLTISVYHLDSGKFGVLCRDDTLRNKTRRQAENELRHLSRVFMDSADPILIENLDGNITNANHAAAEAYGFSLNDLIGRAAMSLVPEKQHNFCMDFRQRCLNGETIKNIESYRKSRSGRLTPVLLTVFALRNEEKEPEALVTIAKDITLLKALENGMKRRSEQLARLTNELTLTERRERRKLARMLHDHLQQLLVGAKIKLETAARRTTQDLYPEISAALQMTLEAVSTARSLSAELSPPVLFSQGLAAGLAWLSAQMEERYAFKVEHSLNQRVKVEQDALKILLFESAREIIFNAVKHSGVKKADLKLEQKNNRLIIRVKDQGKGFDVHQFWEEKAGNPKGFGLFNIRERLQLIGGSMALESRIGEGTTVILNSPDRLDQYADEEYHRL